MNWISKPASRARPSQRAIGGRGFFLVLVGVLLALGFRFPAAAAQASGSQTPSFHSFQTEILPILTKAGCNSGGCHGAATGQGGFRLSLLGYDPDEDFFRITRERGGRRLDTHAPAESLFLRKPSLDLDHEGGKRLPSDSSDYALIERWIASGAPRGSPTLRVASIAVTPAEVFALRRHQPTPLRVVATLSDGQRHDVTRLALFTSNDDGIAQVSKAGVVVPRSPGLTSVMIRYGGQVAAARIAIPYHPPGSPLFDAPRNKVDQHLQNEWVMFSLQPSRVSDDLTFLRRIHIDLVGQLPSLESIRRFTASPGTPDRRLEVIRELLESEAFVDVWTYWFADLLLVGGRGAGNEAVQTYHNWLRTQIAQRTSVDVIARDLLTGLGDIRQSGPANFYTSHGDPRDTAEHVSRSFLGIRIACARCHAHPSDRWTQTDYHDFAAYFARVGRDGNIIEQRTRGEVEHPKTGRPATPRPLGVAERVPSHHDSNPQPGDSTHRTAAEPDRRVELARWLTSPDNPMFARAFVNRVWKHFFGRGLVEPVDDLRPTNPPTHPALLDELAKDFIAHRFDLRRLIQTLTDSTAYQLSSTATLDNQSDRFLYSHAAVRELPAPVFLDAVAQATGVGHAFESEPVGVRAIQLRSPHVPSPALDVLGRCSRERACEASAAAGGGLARALHLLHGETLENKLTGGFLDDCIAQGTPPSGIVEMLYLRTLSRRPTAAETELGTKFLDDPAERRAAAQDLLWALLNSREFGFNH